MDVTYRRWESAPGSLIMGSKRSPKDLAKFLSYVLGRRPDEFGLLTDSDGYVTIKELLKAVNEEDGWGYVRRGHIDEIVASIPDAPIVIDNDMVRARDQDALITTMPARDIPKNLFACVKRKAYPSVREKGIFPGGLPMVILSSDRHMAERIGKRRDHEPVILTINTQKAVDQGVFFYQAGETMFSTKSIPPDCFTGPSLPKPKAEIVKIERRDKEDIRKIAGSFMMEFPDKNEKQKRNARKKRRNEIGWKEDRKKMKRGKHNPWHP